MIHRLNDEIDIKIVRLMQDGRRHLEKLNILKATSGIRSDWHNFVLSEINDHVIRVSVIDRDFHWHRHLDSDEAFIVLEGELNIDLEERTEVLKPGDFMTIPKGVLHRTRAKGRTVNITFEHRSSKAVGDP